MKSQPSRQATRDFTPEPTVTPDKAVYPACELNARDGDVAVVAYQQVIYFLRSIAEGRPGAWRKIEVRHRAVRRWPRRLLIGGGRGEWDLSISRPEPASASPEGGSLGLADDRVRWRRGDRADRRHIREHAAFEEAASENPELDGTAGCPLNDGVCGKGGTLDDASISIS
jgi:hypothetical protein